MTPRKLAAVRANGRHSAGPRTCAGKDRSMLNALKHGQYSQAFRSNLLKAREDVALYDWIYARVCETFQPAGKQHWRECERLARKAWCALRRDRPQNGEARRPVVRGAVYAMGWTPWRRGGLETNPRYVVKTGLSKLTFLSRIRITDANGTRLMFWVRRPRRATLPWVPLSTCARMGSWLMTIALAGRCQAKTACLCLPAPERA